MYKILKIRPLVSNSYTKFLFGMNFECLNWKLKDNIVSMLPVWNLLNVCLCKVLTYNDFNIMLELTANTISIHITEQFQTNSNQINVVNFDCKCLQARRNNVISNNSLRFTASGNCKIVCVLINICKVWKKLIIHT